MAKSWTLFDLSAVLWNTKWNKNLEVPAWPFNETCFMAEQTTFIFLRKKRVSSPFFIDVKGAQEGLSVAGDEWLVGGNPSAASKQRKWDRPLIENCTLRDKPDAETRAKPTVEYNDAWCLCVCQRVDAFQPDYLYLNVFLFYTLTHNRIHQWLCMCHPD